MGKGDMIKEAYSVSAIPRSILPSFVPPTKSIQTLSSFKVESASSSTTSPSHKPQNNDGSTQAELPKKIPLLASIKSDKKASTKSGKETSNTAGHGQQKVKKSGVGFCKSLSNMFAKGMIPVESLWKKTGSPKLGEKSMKSQQSENLPSGKNPSNNSFIQLTKNIQAKTHTKDNTSKGSLSEDIRNEDIRSEDIRNEDIRSEDNPSEENYTKPRNKVFRKRKSCNVNTCEPCSISADCMKCRNCLNKNLK